MTRTYEIGTTFHYIEDHNFYIITELPEEVARFWLSQTLPDHKYNPTPSGSDGWMNKGAVIIHQSNTGYWQAISRHDNHFYLYQERMV